MAEQLGGIEMELGLNAEGFVAAAKTVEQAVRTVEAALDSAYGRVERLQGLLSGMAGMAGMAGAIGATAPTVTADPVAELEGLRALREEYAALDAQQALTAEGKQRLLELERQLFDAYGISASGLTAQGEAYGGALAALDALLAEKQREAQLELELAKAREALAAAQNAAGQPNGDGLREYLAALTAAAGQARAAEAEMARLQKRYDASAKQADAAAKAQSRFNDTVVDLGNKKKAVQHLDELLADLKQIGEQKGAVQRVAELRDRFGDAARGTKAYDDALAEAARATGVSADAMHGSLELVRQGVENDEAAMVGLINQLLAMDGAAPDNAQVLAKLAEIGVSAGDAQAFVDALKAALADLDSVSVDASTGKVSGLKNSSASKAKKSGGGGRKSSAPAATAYRNDALSNALAELAHKMTLELIDPAAELAELERIKAACAKTADEIRDMDERIWAAKKALYSAEVADIQYLRAMRQISAEEEHRLIDEATAKYAISAEQRKEAELASFQRAQRLLSDAYEAEKKRQQRRFDGAGFTLEAYIAELERMRGDYAANADVVAAIDDELYDRRQELRRRELDARYKAIDEAKAAGRIDLQQELAMLREIEAAHALTEEERAEAADRIRDKLLEIRRAEFDEELALLRRRREEGELTTEQLIAQMNLLREKYADDLTLRKQMDQELYDAQRQYMQERADTVTNVAGAVLDALKAQYAAQRDAEKAALKDAQAGWRDWASYARAQTRSVYDDKLRAIEADVAAQLAALDTAARAEDRAAQDEADRRKIAELELQLAHERDAENRYKLEQQLAAAIGARDDRLAKQALDDQREALRAQLADQKEALTAERDGLLADIDAASESASAQLEAQLAELDDYWAERLNTQRLRGEAERLLIADDQEKILALLRDFNPEYDAIGKSWGQKLVAGFGDALAGIAEQAKAQFALAQSAMEESLRGYQAAASPALSGAAPAQPSTVVYLNAGTVDLTEAQLEYLVQRVNRQLGVG